MGAGFLVIRLADGMEALLLEDLLFEIKSGEHVIDTIEWIKEDRKPSEMKITFKEGKCVMKWKKPKVEMEK
jgi:hypothetical protein